MKWFRSLKVGAKLALGFSSILFLTASVGFVGNRVANSIQKEIETIFTVRLPSIDYLVGADRDLHQLLVAERSMVFADAGSDIFEEMVRTYEENIAQSNDRWKKYKALPKTPAELTLIPQYEKAREEWLTVSRQIVEGRKADTRDGRRLALDLTLGAAREKFDAMRGYLDQLEEIPLGNARQNYEMATSAAERANKLILGMTGFTVVVGLFLGWAISASISKSLNRVIEGLAQSSQLVATASAQVSSAGLSLAEGATQQAAALEESSSCLEEMASLTRRNAENAGYADQLTKRANEVVRRANASMNELSAAMDEIYRSSEETSKIIKTIDEIAFQTNLLALNAAVEAARAGEAGAGFAVVADEVRNLALRAADAARNTANLIEGTVKKVKGGAELATRTKEDFDEVTKGSEKIVGLIGDIAAASNEQAQGVDQVNKAVSQMDKVTQQNAAGAEESASASEEMHAQAGQMKVFVLQLEALIGSDCELSTKKSVTTGELRQLPAGYGVRS